MMGHTFQVVGAQHANLAGPGILDRERPVPREHGLSLCRLLDSSLCAPIVSLHSRPRDCVLIFCISYMAFHKV